ncbi:MAG TPA: SDR family oxidoreductase [Spirochaetes bacterium]|nr:SDR family oxidoreductase [Spirochaetota bacterium]
MNKTAVITGATSGIGAAFARRLASEGYDLLVTGRRKALIEKQAAELSDKYGVKVTVIIAELSLEKDLRGLEKRLSALERVDFLVNNAGYGVYENFADTGADEHERMVRVHVTAPVRLTRAVLPGMISRKSGAVINLSSVGSFIPMEKNGMYGGTKAFLNIFSESLNIELRDTGVRVQALCPGFTRTDFHEKLGLTTEGQKRLEGYRWMSADEVVDCSLRCLGNNRVICVPGFSWRSILVFVKLLPRKLLYRIVREKR